MNGRRRTTRFVALKIVKSAQQYRETALDEVTLNQRVASADPHHPGHEHVAEMVDTFEHTGPHGQRTSSCVAVPPMAWPTHPPTKTP